MQRETLQPLLKRNGLRDTHARRSVLEALRSPGVEGTASSIHTWLKERGEAINLVTVYRVLATFERHRLVHRHPCNGHVVLCSMPEKAGDHGFLHCTSCGSVTEFAHPTLSRAEEHVVADAKFHPRDAVREILGTCQHCLS